MGMHEGSQSQSCLQAEAARDRELRVRDLRAPSTTPSLKAQ
jgi:hypothetical protein